MRADDFVRNQTELYVELLDYCALADEAFVAQNLRGGVTGAALEQPLIVMKNKDDAEVAVDQLHSFLTI